jgi:hypothetical protein
MSVLSSNSLYKTILNHATITRHFHQGALLRLSRSSGSTAIITMGSPIKTRVLIVSDTHGLQFTRPPRPGAIDVVIHCGTRFILRKKPGGEAISPVAHRVDREFRVMKALGSVEGFPVPKVYDLCMDTSVIGTEFYVREFLFTTPILRRLTW